MKYNFTMSMIRRNKRFVSPVYMIYFSTFKWHIFNGSHYATIFKGSDKRKHWEEYETL